VIRGNAIHLATDRAVDDEPVVSSPDLDVLGFVVAVGERSRPVLVTRVMEKTVDEELVFEASERIASMTCEALPLRSTISMMWSFRQPSLRRIFRSSSASWREPTLRAVLPA
jgi:hypothetical protein